jgi:glycosyltransferase involved in cell wall biosynthesis
MRFIGCDPERLHVVYNGLHERFRRRISDYKVLSEARSHFGFTWSVTILHVGKCTFYKNIEGIIKSLALLPDGLRNHVHFVKVGEDFTQAQRNLIHRLGLSERVHFLGQLSVEDLVLLYNVADLLLFPSLYEGFGWPPLEAMACGTPVVCSDRGSLKEVVGEAALMVNPEDPKSIANSVESILTDAELREKLVNCGLERAKQFNWATNAEQVLEIYNKIGKTTLNSEKGSIQSEIVNQYQCRYG